MLKTTRLMLLALLIAPIHSALAYSYNGVGGDYDWWRMNYQDLTDTQTQVISVVLNTGNVLLDPAHFGIGGRGPSADYNYPYGRGVTFGHTQYGTGVCVEDFTKNATLGNGLIASTCKQLNIYNNSPYRIDVYIYANNVSYRVYEWRFSGWVFYWALIADGGCIETGGQACAKQPFDGNAGDVFVGQVFAQPGRTWSATDIYVNHY